MKINIELSDDKKHDSSFRRLQAIKVPTEEAKANNFLNTNAPQKTLMLEILMEQIKPIFWEIFWLPAQKIITNIKLLVRSIIEKFQDNSYFRGLS